MISIIWQKKVAFSKKCLKPTNLIIPLWFVATPTVYIHRIMELINFVLIYIPLLSSLLRRASVGFLTIGDSVGRPSNCHSGFDGGRKNWASLAVKDIATRIRPIAIFIVKLNILVDVSYSEVSFVCVRRTLRSLFYRRGNNQINWTDVVYVVI